MNLETGTILATGSGSAVTQTLDGYGPSSMGVVSVSNTFTGITLVVEKKLRGGAVWLPLNMQNEKTLVRTDGSAAPSDSTTTSYRVDLGGAGSWRAYVSAGTPTDVDIELASGAVEEFGGILPAVYTTSTSATTFGAGITFSGATGANDVNLTDNLASALDITESTNSYLNFVTTNSGEKCVFSKDVVLSGAIDLLFSGTTGQSEITLTDNLADALSVLIPSGVDLLVLTTTNSAEAVAVRGLRTTATTAVAITGATTLTLADSGGIFTVGQGSAYDIDLPSPTTGPGCRYFFSLTAPGANNVTITVAGAAATFVGSIVSEGQIIVATGSTLTFATGASLLGDSIEIQSIATNLYHVRATASALNGITVS
jgi:hypothetical protein